MIKNTKNIKVGVLMIKLYACFYLICQTKNLFLFLAAPTNSFHIFTPLLANFQNLVFLSLLHHFFLRHQATKCLPCMNPCRSPTPPTHPPSALSAGLHSGYVRAEVKVSLPLSREEQQRGEKQNQSITESPKH